MRPHLLICLLLFVLVQTTSGQTYYNVPYNVGSPTVIGGNTVTVTSVLGAGSGSHCNITGGYWAGNPNNSGFDFNFTLAVSDVRLRIVSIDSLELISIKINGTPYSLSKNEISPIPSNLNLTCNPTTADTVVNGCLTTFSQVPNGESAQVDIHPGFQIFDIEITHSQVSGNSGSVFLFDFVNDTCNAYSLTPTSNNPCVGDTLKLFANSIPGATGYTWYSNNNPIAYTQNYSIPNADPSMAGSYLAVAQRGACNYGAYVTVNVKPRPTASGTTSNAPICPGQDLHLSTNTVTGATYSWTGPGNYTASQQNPTISNIAFNQQGWYYTRAIVNGCASDPDSTQVILTSSVPSPSFTSVNSPVCPGTQLVLSATSVQGASSYVWLGPNGFSITTSTPTATRNNVAFADSGRYYVAAVVSGCQSIPDSITAEVKTTTPTPNAQDTIVACPATTLTLNVAQTPGATYNWTGPNSFSASGPNPSINNINYTHAGKYYVTATINNCVSHPDSSLVIIDITTPTPNADSAITVCPGTTLQLNVDTLTGATYSWTGPAFSSPSPVQNPAVPNANYSYAGKYFVTAIVNGCVSRPDSTIVTVDITTPTPDADSAVTVCPGTTLHLNVGTIAGAIYSWTGPGTYSSTMQNPVITGATKNIAGTYYVQANVNGCISRPDSTVVHVEITTPTPVVTYNNPVCEGDSISFKTDSINNADFSWKGPNGYTTNAQNPVIKNATPEHTGAYIVQANVDGCVSLPDTVQVTVKKAPSVSVSGTTPICETDTLYLRAASDMKGSFNWTGPNGYTSQEQDITIFNAGTGAQGTYTARSEYDGCTSLSAASIDIKVKPLPAIPQVSSNSPVGKNAKKPGDEVQLTAISNTPGISYSWSGPDGFYSTQQNPAIPNATKNSEGTYKLTTTLDGCTTSSETYVAISTNSYYELYPNPNNGNFTFKASVLNDQATPIEVLNVLGQTVYKDAVEVKGKLLLKTFSLSGLDNGVYFLHIPLKEEDWNIRFIISR